MDEAIAVEIEPGEEYYLRAELIQGFTKNHWHIVQVAKEQGDPARLCQHNMRALTNPSN